MARQQVGRAGDDGDMREELRAVLHAGRELPSRLDDTVIDAFIERLGQHIDARLRQQGLRQPVKEPKPARRNDAGNVSAIIGVGIPFVVLAGIFGHSAGAIVAVIVIGVTAVLQMVREMFD